jgi:hypothetical protein
MIGRFENYLMDNYPTTYVIGAALTGAVAAMIGWKLLVHLIFWSAT